MTDQYVFGEVEVENKFWNLPAFAKERRDVMSSEPLEVCTIAYAMQSLGVSLK